MQTHAAGKLVVLIVKLRVGCCATEVVMAV